MKDLLIHAAIDNPIDGIVPDFSIFGTEFSEWWQKLFAGLWALALIYSAVNLVLGFAAMGASNGNPEAHKEGRKRAVWAGISTAALAAFALIFGGILYLAAAG